MTDFSSALPNELALVSQASANTAAFAALYDHYFSRVYNYARYRLPDAATADDVTAQVFERVLLHIDSYRPEKAPFAAWLFAIARNAVNDCLRRQQRQHWLSLDLLGHWRSAEPQPGDIVAENELQAELLAVVTRLSSRERDLIGLKFAANSGTTLYDSSDRTGLTNSPAGSGT